MTQSRTLYIDTSIAAYCYLAVPSLVPEQAKASPRSMILITEGRSHCQLGWPGPFTQSYWLDDCRNVARCFGAVMLLAEHDRRPKPFTWPADPHKIITAVKRGDQALNSVH